MLLNALQRVREIPVPQIMDRPGAAKSVPRLVQHLALRQADKQYCLQMLATLFHMGIDDIPVFRKNYVPPARGRVKTAVE